MRECHFFLMPLSNNCSKTVQHIILKCHRLIRNIQIPQCNLVFTSSYDFLFHGLWFRFLTHICVYWQIFLCNTNNKEEMEMHSSISQLERISHSHCHPLALSLYTTQSNWNFFFFTNFRKVWDLQTKNWTVAKNLFHNVYKM